MLYHESKSRTDELLNIEVITTVVIIRNLVNIYLHRPTSGRKHFEMIPNTYNIFETSLPRSISAANAKDLSYGRSSNTKQPRYLLK
jgi:hypothetical protein